ncbi:MAG: hypothetical protein EHM35_19715, partial [Planctomycetaceae bacterium]
MSVLLGSWRDRPITISIKPNCITVSIPTGSTEPDVFSYDYEGRPWTALLNGIAYRRGLDGKMVAKWQTLDRGRDRLWLLPAEARQ